MKTKDISLIAVMAAIIVLCSWISVPIAVPFTMQTFGVFAALLILGGKRGTAAILLYILAGIAGLPVFSGFGSGIGHILGPTGGYILGFIFTGILCTLGEKRLTNKSRLCLLAAGLLLCYCIGTLWFAFVSAAGRSVLSILCTCVFPYIIPDVAKLLLADAISRRLPKL